MEWHLLWRQLSQIFLMLIRYKYVWNKHRIENQLSKLLQNCALKIGISLTECVGIFLELAKFLGNLLKICAKRDHLMPTCWVFIAKVTTILSNEYPTLTLGLVCKLILKMTTIGLMILWLTLPIGKTMNLIILRPKNAQLWVMEMANGPLKIAKRTSLLFAGSKTVRHSFLSIVDYSFIDL